MARSGGITSREVRGSSAVVTLIRKMLFVATKISSPAELVTLIRKMLFVATKISSPAEFADVSESLGVAAVFVQDMKEHRRHNYQFSWQRMLNLNGDTGVFIQYTHARLHRSATPCAPPHHHAPPYHHAPPVTDTLFLCLCWTC